MADSKTVEFSDALADAFPCLIPVLREHRTYYGEVLPHVFMGDVARSAVRLFEKANRGDAASEELLRDLLGYLEDAFRTIDEAQYLIAVSFIENLQGEDAAIRRLLGSQMSKWAENHL